MAVLTALAEGISVFTGIERARIKESNRVSAIKEGLQKIGVSVTEDRDRLTITGLKTPKKAKDEYDEKEKDEGESKKVKDEAAKEPVVIESFGDHRIAMAFGVLGIAIGGITIDGAECVAKTFPDFWEVLKSVGGKLEINAK
jgi:3-phosphoshikimate 1-carboxyvinyltransferase